MQTSEQSPFAVTRELWAEKMEAKLKREREVTAVYQTHMTLAAHFFYLAAESIKRGEHGLAASYHAIADQNSAAARKCIPTT